MFHLYGFIISLGVVAFYWLIDSSFFTSHRQIYRRYFWLLIILVFLFSRLYHILSSWSFYSFHKAFIITPWKGGMSIIGGLIGLLLGLEFISWREKISFVSLADPIFLFLPLFQAIGRVANLLNHEFLDKPTSLPWGIYLPPDQRPKEFVNFNYFHPLPAYEMILDLILFFFLLHLARRKVHSSAGQVTAFYFIFYGLIRLLCQPFRAHTNNFFLGGFNLNILFFLLFITFGLKLLYSARIKYGSPQSH